MQKVRLLGTIYDDYSKMPQKGSPGLLSCVTIPVTVGKHVLICVILSHILPFRCNFQPRSEIALALINEAVAPYALDC